MDSEKYKEKKSKDSDKNRNTEQKLLSGSEMLIYIIIGLYFYLPLSNPDAGMIVWFVGISLVINRNITNHFDKESYKRIEERIDRIGQVIDIENEPNLELVSKVRDSYLNITEPEFNRVKNEILNRTLTKLDQLKIQKCSDELSTSEYYCWLFPILENIQKEDSIKAVSCMLTAEWDNSNTEKIFIQCNLDAAKKGATVERIFIMKNCLLHSALKIDAVNKHTKEQQNNTNLKGFFVDRDKLDHEFQLLQSIQDGFIIFESINSKVAVIESYSEGTNIRGKVTMNENIIRELEYSFATLKMLSSELSSSLINIPNPEIGTHKKDKN